MGRLQDVGGVGGVVVGGVVVQALDEGEPGAHDAPVEVELLDKVVLVQQVPAERLRRAGRRVSRSAAAGTDAEGWLSWSWRRCWAWRWWCICCFGCKAA